MHRLITARVLIYLVLLLVLDVALMPLVRVGPVYPSCLYLIIVYAAFEWGWQKTIPMALLAGIFRDLAGNHYLGMEAMSVVFVAIFLSVLVQKLDRDSLWVRMGTTYVFVFFCQMSFLAFASFLGLPYELTWYNFSLSFGLALYTTALMPVFFYFSARWFHDLVSLKQYELFR